jgi:hypothetical protein
MRDYGSFKCLKCSMVEMGQIRRAEGGASRRDTRRYRHKDRRGKREERREKTSRWSKELREVVEDQKRFSLPLSRGVNHRSLSL